MFECQKLENNWIKKEAKVLKVKEKKMIKKQRNQLCPFLVFVWKLNAWFKFCINIENLIHFNKMNLSLKRQIYRFYQT